MRHLNYANVMASVAVFVALGGGAYAAVHVNGKDIENRTVSGKKLKSNTLGGRQIDEGRLGEVPARPGQAGPRRRHRLTRRALLPRPPRPPRPRAPPPPTPRPRPANAADAATLGGDPPSAFLVSCPAATTLYGGVCWDNTARAAANWIAASDTCGNAGGRHPERTLRLYRSAGHSGHGLPLER